MAFYARSLGRLVERWGVPLTATRRALASFVGGVAVPGTASEVSFRGVVQNTKNAQLQRLPEGLRTTDSLAIFTSTQLRGLGSGGLPDLVTFQGRVYEVSDVRDWASMAGFYEIICTKVGDL